MSEKIQDWYAQMVNKLQICGKAERTQDSYTRAVYQLTLHFGKGPEYIIEKELEQYFLYRRNVSGWAPKTLHLMREYWKTHRNPRLLFPALGRGRIDGPTATAPMNRESVRYKSTSEKGERYSQCSTTL